MSRDELDPLLADAIPPPHLTAAEVTVLSAVDEVIATVVAPLADEHDRIGRYPTRAIDALRTTGVLGLAVPAELGGVGGSHGSSLELQVRLAAADSAVAQVVKVHDELVREISVYCPDTLRGPLTARILDGQHILGLAVAEAGKRVDEPWTTTILPAAGGLSDGWVLNGTKIYTTGAAEADEIAVWAFNPTTPGIDVDPLLGFQLSLVPPTTPGVDVLRDWDALGQRATDSGTITFTDVAVPEDGRASVPGRAPLPQNSLRYQAGFAAVAVGVAIGALRAALPFVAASSRPWPSAGVDSAADDPLVRRLCGELVAEVAAAYQATMATGALLDAFERSEVSRTALAIPIFTAKATATRASLRTTSEIYALMGTRSVARNTGFDRFWRNARTLSLHDPVDWKHEEIGRHVLTGWDPPPGIYT